MFSLTILEEKFDVHGYILVQLNWSRFICNQLLSVGFVPLFVLIIYYWLEEKSFKTFNLQKYSFVSYSVNIYSDKQDDSNGFYEEILKNASRMSTSL